MTATAKFAIGCLKDHDARYADQPFFQYVVFIGPYFPLHALPEDIAKYHEKYAFGCNEMRDAHYARREKMGLTKTSLSTLEPDVAPPYASPQAMKFLENGEVNRPLP